MFDRLRYVNGHRLYMLTVFHHQVEADVRQISGSRVGLPRRKIARPSRSHRARRRSREPSSITRTIGQQGLLGAPLELADQGQIAADMARLLAAVGTVSARRSRGCRHCSIIVVRHHPKLLSFAQCPSETFSFVVCHHGLREPANRSSVGFGRFSKPVKQDCTRSMEHRIVGKMNGAGRRVSARHRFQLRQKSFSLHQPARSARRHAGSPSLRTLCTK